MVIQILNAIVDKMGNFHKIGSTNFMEMDHFMYCVHLVVQKYPYLCFMKIVYIGINVLFEL